MIIPIIGGSTQVECYFVLDPQIAIPAYSLLVFESHIRLRNDYC